MSTFPQTPTPNNAPTSPSQTNGMAVASLVVSLVGLCVPLAGVVGAILGFVGLSKAGQRGGAGKGLAMGGIIVGVLSVLLHIGIFFGIIRPGINAAREAVSDLNCKENLKTIFFAAEAYVDRHDAYPPDLRTLVNAGHLDPSRVICPSSPPGGAPTNISYIWLGKGLPTKPKPGTVLAYEPVTNHTSNRVIKRANFLYADGSVTERENPEAYIADLEKGINPPRAN